jgi:hypothetical protein
MGRAVRSGSAEYACILTVGQKEDKCDEVKIFMCCVRRKCESNCKVVSILYSVGDSYITLQSVYFRYIEQCALFGVYSVHKSRIWFYPTTKLWCLCLLHLQNHHVPRTGPVLPLSCILSCRRLVSYFVRPWFKF